MNHRSNTFAYWISWQGMLLAAALASGAIAWWLIAWPVATLSNIADHRGHFALTFLHMAGGTGMLFLGAANLYLAGRKIAFPLHRRIGRAYLAVGAVGAMTAFAVTTSPAHKAAGSQILTNSSVALASLSVAWLGFALLGWRAVRNRRFDSHRDWMIRAYVLVWSFVFCRLGSRVPALGDLGGGEAFAWLSWIGPLILCEIALQWRHGAAMSDRRRAPRAPVVEPSPTPAE
jgi:hypothetical protein